uniref:Thioredoxin n=1 Tax=Chromera velia CCMP2878 TaxID=1169474 RepID=A0A0G4FSW4_9ALVE|mmetsp:Transcript_16330/g.33184  ORF Transcript_16330/g.33184 Transcript_16330/m.33184 type:complete len:106 (+) Transcript_16330:93-410(+)|eukprot:Cvel_3709.t1-p1 / transcript=Cvel_3709.t1 / gene=Cvel_3709 / organism=Chromera_velia_CCMP2878 / gene_product=Thioredoxin, putative / transcript_product=Thioredoxin, putative / location=Cvel_scaffold154:66713-69529(+) / protein_length=105 / sequence_SO=supercontig / SO=protein_coding / is_pseudo=false
MPVKDVSSVEEFRGFKSDAKLCCVDFYAHWCGPCRMMKAAVEELSSKYPQVAFVRVNVEDMSELSDLEGVTAMPTFVFYKNSKRLDEFTGASAATLEATLLKLTS